jgi:hypothetical protein
MVRTMRSNSYLSRTRTGTRSNGSRINITRLLTSKTNRVTIRISRAMGMGKATMDRSSRITDMILSNMTTRHPCSMLKSSLLSNPPFRMSLLMIPSLHKMLLPQVL